MKGTITVKYLEDLGVDKEIATTIFAERGKEIAEMNNEKAELERQLEDYKKNFANLTKEFEDLKQSNADGADWKAKFEQLQNEITAKEEQANSERLAKEKAERNKSMFAKAVEACGKSTGDFSNEFTREGYYNKFVEALESEENSGKSHKDILHALTKDDPTAWKGIEKIKLAGGTPKSAGIEPTKEEFAKMSYRQRLEIYNTNQDLYKKLTE